MKYDLFRKEHLRVNDWIELADGTRARVVLFQGRTYRTPDEVVENCSHAMCIVTKVGCCSTNAYTDDMKRPFAPDKDIVKVIRPTAWIDMCDWGEGVAVFERSQETVLTLQEIADMAGVPVGSLRIVEGESE